MNKVSQASFWFGTHSELWGKKLEWYSVIWNEVNLSKGLGFHVSIKGSAPELVVQQLVWIESTTVVPHS